MSSSCSSTFALTRIINWFFSVWSAIFVAVDSSLKVIESFSLN
jgi:hypothetical protein